MAVRRRSEAVRREDGAVAVMFAVSMVALFGMAALVLDVGKVYLVQSELQTSADAAALGAASMLPDPAAAIARGEAIAVANHDGLSASSVDVITGTWDAGSSMFIAGGANPDAVRVNVFRTAAEGNPVDNSLASVIGRPQSDAEATAVALLALTTLDFSGFSEGATPDTLSHGQGISGEFIPGSVSISATSNRNNSSRCPEIGGEPHCEMIFDGTCSGGCTGGDPDLLFPAQGNILIITEDGDADDPDDEARGGTFIFDFTSLGAGTVSVRSIALLDIDESDQAVVTLFGEGNEVLDVAYLAGAGDGVAVDRFVSGVTGVTRMEVELAGSGAIDDIAYLRIVKIVE